MDGTHAAASPLLTIGDLARRTGLPVRTIRYWAEAGVVPESARSAGGHRLYDAAALARLELVATLRALGLSHAEVRQVLDRESSVAEVAAVHLAALDAEIAALRLRRAVLSAIAAGDREEPGHMDRLHRMARLSARERQQIIDDFAARVCADLAGGSHLRERLTGGGHRLPDDPTQQQLDAWLELSELLADPEFERLARRAAEHSEPGPGGGATPVSGAAPGREPDPHRRFAVNLDRTVGAALRAGVAPHSPQATEVVDRLLGHPGPERRSVVRGRVRARLDAGIDDRLERYRGLLAVMHGQEPPVSRVAAYTWLADALDADADGDGAAPQPAGRR
ncbi:helix-turn-helix domain-containing protein [Actinacidiphila rubida]|uniref:DNA-binding transcriptional regulator, MerR family n=1 Tax=Actinacidiphila rubida TaxID=310780 RepID=A0A1H8FTJ3_9ACTN|nr:MerR family transcriptional regulator [Actinacidiphila rubida]SEN34992.1 DNA-binding transcriptional regulator, MerR family [Actinacidiphila rubida]